MTGWIKISRDISNHWIWKDDTKLKWWLDMLLTVNFKDNKTLLGNQLVECKRGQSIMSLQQWATRWKVDKNKVRNFFVLLEKDGMIIHENMSKTTRITICKYDTYQENENDNKTQLKQKQNAIKTQSNPIEESKEQKESKERNNNLLEKESKRKSSNKIKVDKLRYGEFENVLLTEEEYFKAQEKYGQNLEAMIQKLSAFVATKKKDPYASHFAAFSSWVYKSILEDNQRNGNQGSKQNGNISQWPNGSANGIQRPAGKQPHVFSGAEFSAKVQERLEDQGLFD